MVERDKGRPGDSRQPFLPLSWESGEGGEANGNQFRKPAGREAAPGGHAGRAERQKERQAEEPKPPPAQRREPLVNRKNLDEPLAGEAEKAPPVGGSATAVEREDTGVRSSAPKNIDQTQEASVSSSGAPGSEGAESESSASGQSVRSSFPPARAEGAGGGAKFEAPGEDEEARAATGAPESEASLGTVLMQGRKENGLAIDEVSRRTRIPRDFIENVEADRLEQLPPAVYSRSYIAQLCRHYGLPPEVCLRVYDRSQAVRLSERRNGDSPLVLVIDNDSEDGSTVSYVPRPADRYGEADSGLLSRLPRFAVMFATGLLLLVVLSAVVVQQYRNYRLRRSEAAVEVEDTEPMVSPQRVPGLEELVPPQELPLRELSIPGE